MMTSLLAPGTPALQSPPLFQLLAPPFQLSGVLGGRMSTPPGSPPCDSVKFPTAPDALFHVLCRPPLWSDNSLQSASLLRRGSDFLVAAEPVATDRTTHTSRASDARFMSCLSCSRGGDFGDRRALRVAHL